MPGPCSTPKLTGENGEIVEGKTATRKIRKPGEPVKVKVKKPVRYRPLIIDPDEEYE